MKAPGLVLRWCTPICNCIFSATLIRWKFGNRVNWSAVYGVAQGALFCGESMFSHATNASKCSLMAFCRHFAAYGGELIDCQVLNAQTA